MNTLVIVILVLITLCALLRARRHRLVWIDQRRADQGCIDSLKSEIVRLEADVAYYRGQWKTEAADNVKLRTRLIGIGKAVEQAFESGEAVIENPSGQPVATYDV